MAIISESLSLMVIKNQLFFLDPIGSYFTKGVVFRVHFEDNPVHNTWSKVGKKQKMGYQLVKMALVFASEIILLSTLPEFGI